jgi:hypothetical protein
MAASDDIDLLHLRLGEVHGLVNRLRVTLVQELRTNLTLAGLLAIQRDTLTEVLEEAGHAVALEEANGLVKLDPSPDTPEGRRLEHLVTLIEEYEKRRWPIGPVEGTKTEDFRDGKWVEVAKDKP